MRIAQVAPLSVRVPPDRYGGTERVIAALTDGLVARGHAVTLFAAGGSGTDAKLHASSPGPLWDVEVADPLAYRVLQVEELVRRSGDFDVIHSHIDYLPWLAGARLKAPLVTTLHGRLDLPELRPLLSAFAGWPLVSISDAQRGPVADLDLRWMATVAHGFELDSAYSLGGGEGGHLAFLGRIAPEKDPVAAIRVAILAGVPIKIAARLDPVDEPYFEREVRPLLDHPLVEWIGEQDERGKQELLGSARALLLPIAWDEPFGLTFVEALACGTPVISRPRGSLPEIVRDGRDGFLREDDAGLVQACSDVLGLDRAECRRSVLERYSRGAMVAAYEKVYARLAGVAALAPVGSGLQPALAPARAGRPAHR